MADRENFISLRQVHLHYLIPLQPVSKVLQTKHVGCHLNSPIYYICAYMHIYGAFMCVWVHHLNM